MDQIHLTWDLRLKYLLTNKRTKNYPLNSIKTEQWQPANKLLTIIIVSSANLPCWTYYISKKEKITAPNIQLRELLILVSHNNPHLKTGLRQPYYNPQCLIKPLSHGQQQLKGHKMKWIICLDQILTPTSECRSWSSLIGSGDVFYSLFCHHPSFVNSSHNFLSWKEERPVWSAAASKFDTLRV